MRRNSARLVKLFVIGAATVLLTLFLYKTASLFLGPSTIPDSTTGSATKDDGSNARGIWGVMERLRAVAVDAHEPGNDAADAAAVDAANPQSDFFGSDVQQNPTGEKIDWQDHAYLEQEAHRIGLGEQGASADLTDPKRAAERQDGFDQNGFNAMLSEAISVNRSVADIRHKDCAKIKYLKDLPTVSVVVPFYNEHWTTLLRTCYSVLNRSPAHLIKEIILVDDFSDRVYLKAKLDIYVAEHLPKVRHCGDNHSATSKQFKS